MNTNSVAITSSLSPLAGLAALAVDGSRRLPSPARAERRQFRLPRPSFSVRQRSRYVAALN